MMDLKRYKRNKRHLIGPQQSKMARTRSEARPEDYLSNSNVKPLSEVKNTSENRSFSGLDYDLMKDMFKGRGRAILEAAKALRDSPPTVSEFEFSENQSQSHFIFGSPISTNHATTTKPMPSVNIELASKYMLPNNIRASNIPEKLSSNEIHESKRQTQEPLPKIITVSTPTEFEHTPLLSQINDTLLPPSQSPTVTNCDNDMLQSNTLSHEDKIYSQLTTVKPLSKPNNPEECSSFNDSPSLLCPDVTMAIENYGLEDQSFTLLDTDNLTDCETPLKQKLPILSCSLSKCENDNILHSEILSNEDKVYSQLTTVKPLSKPNIPEEKRGSLTSSPSLLCPDITMAIENNDFEDQSFTLLDDDNLTDCETPLKETLPIPSCSSRRVPFNIEPDCNSDSRSEVDDSDADPDFNPHSNIEYDKSDESDQFLSSFNDNSTTVAKTRKKKADPTKWKRNEIKTLRNSGKEYTNLKGNVVTSKIMGPTCNDKCKLKCSTKFTESERNTIFEEYWALGDINKQRQFISSVMETIQPKYRYTTQKENQRPRCLNHAFYFQKDKLKERVCKTFFVSTLGITFKYIRTVIDKTNNGFMTDDLRGKHDNRPKVSEKLKDRVRKHITSIPAVESHYVRACSTKKYIEGGRTLVDLYGDYKKDCQEEQKDFVTFSMYRNIFNYEFNLEFFKPKKDLCQFCETYKNSNREDQLDKEIEYMLHHEEKNLSRDEKANDKSKINKSYRVACFDLQAALPTPKGEVSTFYYKSKLSTYNFTICELTNKKGLGPVHCYIWHEGEGHKGSKEIGSCLMDYLKQCVSETSDEIEVVLYSDNCGGQNKNKFIITAYMYAVANLNIKAITHKFLVVGHTQNEGDVCHSLIEKNIKKALKASPIYVPAQYVTLISTAKKSGAPFKVHELDHDFFVDLKDLADTTTTNFNINSDEEKINFNDICVMRVEKEHPNCFFYKTSYKQEEYKTVNVARTKTRKQLAKFSDVQLTKAYCESIAISKKIYDDLISLVNSKTIPHCHAAFFQSLKHD